MKITRLDGTRTRTILVGMIVDDVVCGRIASKWAKDGLFESKFANIIASWCCKYYKGYGKAPGKNIKTIFEEWAESPQSDKDTVSLIERLLQTLDGHYKLTRSTINSKFILEMAARHFEEVSISKLSESLKEQIESGKLPDAKKILAKFNPPKIDLDASIDLFQDTEVIRKNFELVKESIIKYPGDAGKFFAENLEREGFIAFMGSEKKGKTFWLLDMAWRAALQRRKVAFFEVGDLTERQIIHRFGVRAARRPLRPTKEGRPVYIPKSLEFKDNKKTEIAVLKDVRVDYKDGLSWQEANKALKQIAKEKIRSNDPFIKLSVHATRSLSVQGMRSIIDGWGISKWVPDVVIVDYADILAPPPGFNGDSRDAVNETWMALRRLSQELKCLVVTATQTKAAAYTAETLTMEHFSEDKRKFAHVTGMVGINQSDVEKENGIQALNWLVLREDEFLIRNKVYVGGSLAIANPCVCSLLGF